MSNTEAGSTPKVLYFYTKDLALIQGPQGAMIKNPIPKNLRQRRQVIAGVVEDGKLRFGRSGCHYHDQFVKKVGRTKAMYCAKFTPIDVIDAPGDLKEIGRVFVDHAKTLIIPPPEIQLVDVTKTIYQRVLPAAVGLAD